MKGNDALQNAYNKQKKQFEEAKATRITNRKTQMADIRRKIDSLEQKLIELETLNQKESNFETFESFRLKAEQQSRKQKN